MTSRDVSRRRLDDPLDAMIRWVLRESLGDVRPPAGTWRRITERLIWQTSVKRLAWREGFRRAGEVVALWFLAISAVSARTELTAYGLGDGGAWEGNPLYLADQYGILLRTLTVL